MNLTWTIVIVALALLGAAALLLISRTEKGGNYLYSRHPFLLSKAELAFYGVLRQAVGGAGAVFAKVRVADVISPKKGLSRPNWQRAFNGISAKHFDFLVCDPATSKVLVAVELDDVSHNTSRTKARDQFLQLACEAAELPLLRVTAAKAYSVADLRANLAGASVIGPSKSDPVIETAASEDRGSSPPIPIAVPKCPKCGAETLLRRAKSGVNAGKEFWGCATFPKCRGSLAKDA